MPRQPSGRPHEDRQVVRPARCNRAALERRPRLARRCRARVRGTHASQSSQTPGRPRRVAATPAPRARRPAQPHGRFGKLMSASPAPVSKDADAVQQGARRDHALSKCSSVFVRQRRHPGLCCPVSASESHGVHSPVRHHDTDPGVLLAPATARATYSVVATDSATGQVGGAVTSCVGIAGRRRRLPAVGRPRRRQRAGGGQRQRPRPRGHAAEHGRRAGGHHHDDHRVVVRLEARRRASTASST